MNTPALHHPADGLEQLLTTMLRYGKPRIARMDRGWYCVIEMNTNVQGASFDIKSEHAHQSPRDAAQQCLDRIVGAVKTIGGAA